MTLGLGLAQFSLLGGCSILSRDGPSVESIEGAAAASVAAGAGPVFDYVLLDITEQAVKIFGTPPVSSLFATFGRDKGPPPEIRVGVGDVVQVTVFEAQAGGLFIPAEAGVRPGNYVTIPPEVVDRRGTLTIPYAGRIPAVGKTIPDLENAITQALSNRAIEPQVVVSIVSRSSSQASVVGAVNTPSKIEVGPKGERVLDMIAKANGINAPGYEIYITVQRGNRKATVYFDTILANPKENIFIRPGDTIYAYRDPHRFSAFGAVRTSGLIDFGQPRLTLVEAVAKASGLDDARADPRDVFLYRNSPRDLLLDANVNLDKFPPDQDTIPVIFRANFRDSSNYFAALDFKLSNKDVIYVSNSGAYELYKFLDLINNTSTTAATVPYNLATSRASGAALGLKAVPITPTTP
ncbi:polysaccharide export outer membrane protein [Rhodoblastus acidophilus]|uniref:Polysaccharide export outer membrane protein n=2 Tax=Rhodoblastus acidophilus TaxID=1074 RepID=A0A212Q0C6_RHOAC|nr:polysaccharide export outer membrane protein [Rhodoblastus acidophilus]